MTNNVSSQRTVTLAEFRKAAYVCVKAKRPIMNWGPPGIGKSEAVAQLCESMGGKLYDIRLPLLEPTDLRGMPFYNKETNRMEWAAPVDLPDEETAAQYPIVFLFLDELNGAAPSVQAAAYQLILNRQIGQYKLPDNVVIVAAGNRDGDKGVTYRMPAPLANRFVHFETRVDFDSWLEWAALNKINKDVVGFLNFSKDSLYDFDPKSPNRSFATPRSWHFVSQLLDDTTDEATLTNVISGTIGEGMALKFLAHRKVASKLPDPKQILQGKVEELKIKEVSAHYSLAISCCYELDDQLKKLNGKPNDDWHNQSSNFLEFMMKFFPQVEVTVMAMRMALQTYKLPFSPSKMKSFDEFQSKFGKLIIKASS